MQAKNKPSWFDMTSLFSEDGQFGDDIFNKLDAEISANKIMEVIHKEVAQNLDGSYS